MTALLLIAMLGVSGLARAESSVYVQNNTSFTFSVASEATRGSLSPSYWQQRSRSIQPGARVEVLRFNRDRGITNGRLFELESTLRSGRQSLTLKQRLRGKFVGSTMWQSLRGPGFNDRWFRDRSTHTARWVVNGVPVNVKYRAYFTGGDDDIEYILQEVNRVQPGPDDHFDVLSYNVYLRPTTLFVNGQNIRARLIPPQIRGYDAIVFQEAFDDGARRRLLAPLRREYPYQTRVLGTDSGVVQDGGVVIASRWPIVSQRQVLFGSACEGSDCLSDKGVLYAAINKGGRIYHVFGTHLDADDAVTRSRQLRIMQSFVRRINPPRTDAVFYAGDFNIDRRSRSRTEYTAMLRRLNAVAPRANGLRFSHDGRISDLYNGGRQLLDHVFYSRVHRRPIQSLNTVRMVRASEEWKELVVETARWDLSDHFPVQGHFEFQPPSTTGGTTDGSTDGSTDGTTDGTTDGSTDGSTDGTSDGTTDGSTDGSTDGTSDGSTDGTTDGTTDGSTDGGNSGLDEDCLPHDIDELQVAQIGGRYKITNSARTRFYFDFDQNKEEALKSLKIMQFYRSNNACYVERPGPAMIYLLTETGVPVGSFPDDDCISFRPDNLEVKEINGRWTLVDGNVWLFNFRTDQDAAEKAKKIVQFYEFDQTCYVGRPDPSFKYLVRSSDSTTDGTTDGSTDGNTDGTTDGNTDGTTDGTTDGNTDGSTDGSTDGGTGELEEDCLAHDTDLMFVKYIRNRWKITNSAGTRFYFDFDQNEDEANRSLEIMKTYQTNNTCYIERPNPPVIYLKTDGGVPEGAISGEDCIAFDRDTLTANLINGNWIVGDRISSKFNFRTDKEGAEKAVKAINFYEFNQSCFVGRPDPSFRYLRR